MNWVYKHHKTEPRMQFHLVVTGGFTDLYNPSSLRGQILTGLLVLSGMILVGVFTTTLTTVYMGDDNSEIEKNQQRLRALLDEFKEDLQNLQIRLNEK